MIEYIFVDVLAFAHIQSRSLFRGEGVWSTDDAFVNWTSSKKADRGSGEVSRTGCRDTGMAR